MVVETTACSSIGCPDVVNTDRSSGYGVRSNGTESQAIKIVETTGVGIFEASVVNREAAQYALLNGFDIFPRGCI